MISNSHLMKERNLRKNDFFFLGSSLLLSLAVVGELVYALAGAAVVALLSGVGAGTSVGTAAAEGA